ncbi:MAG: primosomal protein N' [Sphaerochaetaceae bacterium]|nr:primosomal protein N' [Sphaerochaetaceae bacterium]MDD4258295.1 primosomal protein N' [Sphaerochaetaceae bacterium]NLO60902.1 primosomal protein N' [Spirochaetales bacterium]
MFVHVLLNTPLTREFTYDVPEGIQAEIGMRCIVPFGNREVTAYIVGVASHMHDTSFEIKPIKRLIDKQPIFSSDLVRLAYWMSKFYLCSPGEALSTMIPGGRRDAGIPPFVLADDFSQIEDADLSNEQKQAIDLITNGQSSLHYLYGITGSGKSEVFLRVTQHVIDQKKQVIYLVPEITLTHQLAGQVLNRFKGRVAILHSGLTPSQRLAEWRKIKNGEVDLAIGARSAVFAPFDRLGMIIIDEEHENSYKAGNTPRYHARQVAQYRVSIHGALLLMGSATPSLEAWQMMVEGQVMRHDLSTRVAGGVLPSVSIVNMQAEQRTLSHKLLGMMDEVLSRKKQVILFLNRRGFSYFFHCKYCGFEMTCPHCSVALTFHKELNKMVCHYCGHRQQPISVCPECSSVDVGYSGFGIEMVEQEVRSSFPYASIARLDTDIAHEKGIMASVLDDFKQGKIDILLGTQMVAKGLNFPLVELVGIVNADSSLNLPDFRAQERAFSLIVQVSGRAGRFNNKGKVLVQTFRSDNPAVAFATSGQHQQFYDQELAARKAARFPPFSRLINFTVRSASKEKARIEIEKIAQIALTAISHLEQTHAIVSELPEIVGYAPCPLEKIAGNWRQHLVLRGNHVSNLLRVAGWIHSHYKAPSRVYLEVDVDPLQML